MCVVVDSPVLLSALAVYVSCSNNKNAVLKSMYLGRARCVQHNYAFLRRRVFNKDILLRTKSILRQRKVGLGNTSQYSSAFTMARTP